MASRHRESRGDGKTLAARLGHAACGLLFLLGSGPAGLSNVLCIGADGHISLEQAAAPCCGDAAATGKVPSSPRPEAASFHPLPSPDRGACGDCIDIPLATAGTLATARHPSRAADPLHPELALALLAIAPAAPAAACVQPPPASGGDPAPPSPRGALSHLRSVVLRC